MKDTGISQIYAKIQEITTLQGMAPVATFLYTFKALSNPGGPARLGFERVLAPIARRLTRTKGKALVRVPSGTVFWNLSDF
jgi:hypothetical protein